MTRGRAVVLALAMAMALPGPVGAGDGGPAGVVTGRVRASPILVTLTLSTPTASTGQAVKAEARVTNLGRTTIRSIVLELRADGAGLAIQRPVNELTQLKPSKSATATWSVCGRSAGSYVLLVRSTLSGVSIDSPARLLTITTGGRKVCP